MVGSDPWHIEFTWAGVTNALAYSAAVFISIVKKVLMILAEN
jgi:hypothetical protein